MTSTKLIVYSKKTLQELKGILRAGFSGEGIELEL